ncbi:hypothetical protein ACFVMC_07015 [Nocardia sp. NPDC127579]|uniref:hypothetical protein n=1 Tax=Nocardia sp. NPDC127579 TaxID=3345402 RepID=UPI0036454F3A
MLWTLWMALVGTVGGLFAIGSFLDSSYGYGALGSGMFLTLWPLAVLRFRARRRRKRKIKRTKQGGWWDLVELLEGDSGGCSGGDGGSGCGGGGGGCGGGS